MIPAPRGTQVLLVGNGISGAWGTGRRAVGNAKAAVGNKLVPPKL
jgi:hypothetical protein